MNKFDTWKSISAGRQKWRNTDDEVSGISKLGVNYLWWWLKHHGRSMKCKLQLLHLRHHLANTNGNYRSECTQLQADTGLAASKSFTIVISHHLGMRCTMSNVKCCLPILPIDICPTDILTAFTCL